MHQSDLFTVCYSPASFSASHSGLAETDLVVVVVVVVLVAVVVVVVVVVVVIVVLVVVIVVVVVIAEAAMPFLSLFSLLTFRRSLDLDVTLILQPFVGFSSL